MHQAYTRHLSASIVHSRGYSTPLLGILWAALTLLLAPVAAAQKGNPDCGTEYTCCTGVYALCTSARCAPIARSDNHDLALPVDEVLCECVVATGPNVGSEACELRQQGDSFLLSTFSFEQFRPPSEFKSMSCPVSAAGAACLDAPCIIDSSDSSKAWCTCDYEEPNSAEHPWVTLGGGCITATCDETIWSGATLKAISEASEALVEYMGLSAPPIASCNSASEGP